MKLTSYRKDHNLAFPINIGRNAAHDASITHYVFPTDIDLFPSENVVDKFQKLIAYDQRQLVRNRVFVLPVFEVSAVSRAPWDKTELSHMLMNKTAFVFSVKYCPGCHIIPDYDHWLSRGDMNGMYDDYTQEIKELLLGNPSTELSVLRTTKRFYNWEPMFIAPRTLPYFDERNFYEIKADRMTHATVMCLLDYNYAILDSVFLVHRPGMKLGYTRKTRQKIYAGKESIKQDVFPDYISLYGPRVACIQPPPVRKP